MPLDLPTTLALARVDLALIEETLNGLKNTKCADKEAADKADIESAIKTYEHYLLIWAPVVAGLEAAGILGYPQFPAFPVSLPMKARLQKELKASTVAERLFVGRASAVSGKLSFSGPIPIKTLKQ